MLNIIILPTHGFSHMVICQYVVVQVDDCMLIIAQLEDHLEAISEDVMPHFARQAMDTAIGKEEPMKSPERHEIYVPLDAMEQNPERQVKMALSSLTNEITVCENAV